MRMGKDHPDELGHERREADPMAHPRVQQTWPSEVSRPGCIVRLVFLGACVAGAVWLLCVPHHPDQALQRAQIVAQAILSARTAASPIEKACSGAEVGGSPIRFQIGSRVCRDTLKVRRRVPNLGPWISTGVAVATVQTRLRDFVVLQNLDVAELKARDTAVVKLEAEMDPPLPPECYPGRAEDVIFDSEWASTIFGKVVHR